MATVLEACALRLNRAAEHLTLLNDEVESFIQEVRDSMVGHFYRESGEYVFRLFGEPPPHWGLLVGEYAHELRAVLDNLVWALVEKRGQQGTTQHTFLISETKPHWQSNVGSALGGLLKSDKTLVQRHQPYHRGNEALNHPLSRLRWMNNSDKHRLLHPSAAASGAAPFPLPERVPCFPVVRPGSLGRILGIEFQNPVLRKEGTEFCWVTLGAAGPDPKVDMHGEVPIAVSLTSTERPVTPLDLLGVGREVAEITTEFEPLLK